MRRPSKEMHFEALDFDFTEEIINQGKPDVSLLLLQDKTFDSLACKFCSDSEELGVHSKPDVGRILFFVVQSLQPGRKFF